MNVQCPNCMDHLWEWERHPTGDVLTCRACGVQYAVIGLDGHTTHIVVQPPKTIGHPDTVENLGGI